MVQVRTESTPLHDCERELGEESLLRNRNSGKWGGVRGLLSEMGD